MSEVIKELETVIEVNGREVAATIKISAEQDDDFDSTDMDFENEQERARFERRLARGDIAPMLVLVEVSALGEAETVGLSSVLVEKPGDVEAAVDEHGLIAEATEFVVKAINERYETLKPYFAA